MKKKIISMALCLSMLALLIAGGTLAYFTDTASVTNVITAGNIQILLHEDNGEEGDAAYAKDEDYRKWLVDQPFVPSNTLPKEVTVENTGSQPAYVRVHIGIPSAVMNAYTDPTLTAGDYADDGEQIAALNFNHADWNIYNADGTVNSYFEEIHGTEYFVIVATYNNVLEAVGPLNPSPASIETTNSLVSMHMYDTVECSDKYPEGSTDYFVRYTRGAKEYEAAMGQLPVLVCAEAGQQFNFNEATTALNTQFGTPATTVDYVSPLVNLFDTDGRLVDSFATN